MHFCYILGATLNAFKVPSVIVALFVDYARSKYPHCGAYSAYEWQDLMRCRTRDDGRTAVLADGCAVHDPSRVFGAASGRGRRAVAE